MHRTAPSWTKALAWTLSLSPLACKPSNFSASQSNAADNAATANGGASGTGPNGTGGNANGTGNGDGTGGSNTAANGGLGGGVSGSGGSLGASGNSGSLSNNANPSCSAGCCPSQNIAFVDCSGNGTTSLNSGGYTVTPVSCNAVESSTTALSAFDTIFYYGPTDYRGTGKLPPAVDAQLTAGAKVIAYMSSNGASPDNPFYSLTLEHNLEFASNIGGSTISAPNTNAMTAAFSQQHYASANLTYLMFLGPFLLVNGSLFSSEMESHWCSDLTARSVLGVQMTTFHGYLLDDSSRRGLLIASTLSVPNSQTGFDFTDAFVSAQLGQRWNSTGNSVACGLPCGTSVVAASSSIAGSPGSLASGGGNANGVSSSGSPGVSSPSGGLLGSLGGLGGLGGLLGGGGGNSPQGGNTGSVPGFTNATGVGKPVLYLYPTVATAVDVKLDFTGQLVTTYPKYDDDFGGWQVHASPDGQLTDASGQSYSYIYWNGTTEAFVPDFTSGFVVKGEDSRDFLQVKLAALGLSAREANDMIVYWLPYLERHKYNLVHFAGSEYTSLAKMAISPEPDSLLRVFMVFKGLDQPVTVPEQKLAPFVRHGFAAVEWGGSEIGGDWHVIH